MTDDGSISIDSCFSLRKGCVRQYIRVHWEQAQLLKCTLSDTGDEGHIEFLDLQLRNGKNSSESFNDLFQSRLLTSMSWREQYDVCAREVLVLVENLYTALSSHSLEADILETFLSESLLHRSLERLPVFRFYSSHATDEERTAKI